MKALNFFALTKSLAFGLAVFANALWAESSLLMAGGFPDEIQVPDVFALSSGLGARILTRPADATRFAEIVAGVGFGAVRIPLSWERIEGDSRGTAYDFSEIDRLIDELRATRSIDRVTVQSPVKTILLSVGIAEVPPGYYRQKKPDGEFDIIVPKNKRYSCPYMRDVDADGNIRPRSTLTPKFKKFLEAAIIHLENKYSRGSGKKINFAYEIGNEPNATGIGPDPKSGWNYPPAVGDGQARVNDLCDFINELATHIRNVYNQFPPEFRRTTILALGAGNGPNAYPNSDRDRNVNMTDFTALCMANSGLPGFPSRVFGKLLRNERSGGGNIDGISYHPYPELSRGSVGQSPESYLYATENRIVRQIRTYNDQTLIRGGERACSPFITEFGWTALGTDKGLFTEQAEAAVRGLLSGLRNRSSFTCYYSALDASENVDGKGLAYINGSKVERKNSYYAVRALLQQLENFEKPSNLPLDNPTPQAPRYCAIRMVNLRSGKYKYVVWKDTNADVEIIINAPRSVTQIKRVKIPVDGKREATLEDFSPTRNQFTIPLRGGAPVILSSDQFTNATVADISIRIQ